MNTSGHRATGESCLGPAEQTRVGCWIRTSENLITQSSQNTLTVMVPWAEWDVSIMSTLGLLALQQIVKRFLVIRRGGVYLSICLTKWRPTKSSMR